MQALEGMFDGSSPNARLSRIKACAVAYPDDSRLADEIEWVEQRLQKSNGNAEWDELHALTAIERGLDLLHTRKHLAAVIERELRNEKDQARGARMATLPQGD
ncbi:MAG: hypothetical protein KGL43_01525, partial [Burkholderiales bacterium]|nr:hypothetical protein [Burkholderiales bacterium]